jgi:hypothetical protein
MNESLILSLPTLVRPPEVRGRGSTAAGVGGDGAGGYGC